MKNLLYILLALTSISCVENGKDGKNGSEGASTFGLDAVSTGVDFADIEPGLACLNGGTSVFTFQDKNSDGLLQSDENILKIKSLCNGLNGTNGTNGTNAILSLESIASSTLCPNGGIKFTSGSSTPVEVCNGINGINGEDGLPGMQGIPGLAGSNGADGADGTDGTNGTNGTNGTSITPVKFCSTDNSTFPEYGLLIGNDLFAVYWGTTPASPSTPQAFLTKLVAGNYMSTGGNNCLFSIH